MNLEMVRNVCKILEYILYSMKKEKLHIWSSSDKGDRDVSGEASNDFQTMSPHHSIDSETLESREVLN